jgi:hypothetical protein
MKLARISLFVALSVAAGCAGTSASLMSDQEISGFGTKSYAAPKPKVFNAAVDALKAQGYSIASKDEEKGTILTTRKVIRSVAVGNAYSATAIDVTRQYYLQLSHSGGQTVVVARPRVFQGEADLSAQKVWDLEGPVGERALWTGLFRQIGELL